jgi:hypothetical protein
MHRIGHKLTIVPHGKFLVATCECGQWRRTLSVPDDADMMNVVGRLAGSHDRHLERLGRPSPMGDSGEGPLIPPEEPK